MAVLCCPDEVALLIVGAGKALQEKALIERTWGNVSFRLDADFFAITPTGASYEGLAASDIVVVDVLSLAFRGKRLPSSELLLHTAIYRAFPKACCILHTHQKWASILSLFAREPSCNVEIPKHLQKIFGTFFKCTAYAEAGTEQIAQNVVQAVKDSCKGDFAEVEEDAVLMMAHGIVVFAKSMENAFFLVEKLEELAKSIVVKQIQNCTNGANLTWECKAIIKYYWCGGDFIRNVEEPKNIDEALFGAIEALSKQHVYNIALSASPALLYSIALFSKKNISGLGAYFDDVAQIAGAFFRLVSKEDIEKGFFNSFEKTIKSSKIILVEGLGALCFAENKEELVYMSNLFEKNIYAFLLSLSDAKIAPLESERAGRMHASYLRGYSRLNT